MRSKTHAAAAGVLLAGPTVLAFFSGGFFDLPRLWAGIGAWLLVLVAVIASERPLPRGGAAGAALGGLALLTVWSALSLLWAPLLANAVDDLQRLLLYLGALVAAAPLLRPRAVVRAVEPALAGGALVVICYAVSERLVPELVTLERGVSAAGRLEQPLTYWNAMGALAALGFVLGVRLAGDPTRHRLLRAAAAAAAPVLGLGLFLSLSRGAIAACAAGLVALLLAAPTRTQLRAAAVAVAAALPVAGASLALPSVRTLDGGAGAQTVEGAAMLAMLALAGAAAAVVTWRFAARPEPADAGDARARLRRRLAIAAALACTAAVAAVSLAAGESRTIRRPPQAEGPARLQSVATNRYDYWTVSLAAFADSPLDGLGLSGFRVEWLRRRDLPDPAKDAHSLYVETAAELGLPGLLALGLFLAGVGWSAAAALRRDPVLAAGPVAAVSLWAVHAGVDWDWEMPAVTLVALLSAGALVAAGDP